MSNRIITEDEKRQNLYKIIHKNPTAMFVTAQPQGLIHARPMATAQVPENLELLYFAASRNSAKIDALRQSNQVMLTYTDNSGKFAAINGRARLVGDRDKIRELWSPFWKNWFEGPDDPELILIAVIPDTAEYWDSGNRLLVMAKLVFAAATGKKVDEGENEKLNLQHAS